MTEGPARTAALDHLHRGQSNDCYWHGLFGGIYISHMRLATYEHLIAAEDAADRALGTQRVAETRDLDMDGLPEAFLADPGQVVTVKPASGAGIGSWDVRGGLARARRGPPPPARGVPRDAARRTRRKGPGRRRRRPHDGGAPASIHDIVMVKEEGLSRRLFYDDHERRSALVRFLAPDVTPEAVARAADARAGRLPRRDVRGSTISSRARCRCRARARRSASRSRSRSPIRLGGDRLHPTLVVEVEVHHRGDAPIETRLGLEWSLHLLGGGGNPSAWYDVARRADRARRHGRGRGRRRDRLRQRLGRGGGRGAADARRGRLVGADRDRLELRVRLRARVPGQRPAPVVAADPRARRVPPVRRRAVGDRRPRPDGGGGRGPGLSAASLRVPVRVTAPVPATLPR